MFEKRLPYRNPEITKSAKGETCTLRLNGCGGADGTVVWAHSNYLEDGKGASQKADDIFGCYACQNCHDILDGRKAAGYSIDEMPDLFHRAMKLSLRKLLDKGVIK